MQLLRVTLVAAFAAIVACTSPSLAPGAIQVHGVPGQGTLFLDGVDRGPVQQLQRFDGLAPGLHVLELRRGGVPVFVERCVVRPAMLLDVRIDVAALAAASAPAPARARNSPERAASAHAPSAPAPSPLSAPGAPPASASTDAPPEPERTLPETVAPEPPDDSPAAFSEPASPEPSDSGPASPEPASPEPASPEPSGSEPSGSEPLRGERSVARPSSPSRAPSTRATSRRAHDEELDALLTRALEGSGAAPRRRDEERAAAREAERAAAPPLPEVPSAADVQRVMAQIAPAVRACMRDGDTVTLGLTVAGATGRTTNVAVTGPLAGTPAGACAARAARAATFPPFGRRSYTLQLPFRR